MSDPGLCSHQVSSPWPRYVAGLVRSLTLGLIAALSLPALGTGGVWGVFQDSGSLCGAEVFRGNFALPCLLQAVTACTGPQALAETYLLVLF